MVYFVRRRYFRVEKKSFGLLAGPELASVSGACGGTGRLPGLSLATWNSARNSFYLKGRVRIWLRANGCFWARIYKAFKEPGIYSQPGGPVELPYWTYRPANARICKRLRIPWIPPGWESIPRFRKRKGLQIRAQDYIGWGVDSFSIVLYTNTGSGFVNFCLWFSLGHLEFVLFCFRPLLTYSFVIFWTFCFSPVAVLSITFLLLVLHAM